MHCSEAWVQGCGDESIVIVVKCGGDPIYLAILAFCPPEWAVNCSTSEHWQLKRLHSLLSLMRYCCLGKFVSSCDLQGGQAWHRNTTGVCPPNSGEDFNIVLSIWTFYSSDTPSREKCVGVFILLLFVPDPKQILCGLGGIKMTGPHFQTISRGMYTTNRGRTRKTKKARNIPAVWPRVGVS